MYLRICWTTLSVDETRNRSAKVDRYMKQQKLHFSLPPDHTPLLEHCCGQLVSSASSRKELPELLIFIYMFIMNVGWDVNSAASNKREKSVSLTGYFCYILILRMYRGHPIPRKPCRPRDKVMEGIYIREFVCSVSKTYEFLRFCKQNSNFPV